MDHSSVFHWNFLPTEMKMLVVKQMTKNCRLALRTCSRNDKELVDSVKIKKIQKIEMKCFSSMKFRIAIKRTEYSEWIVLNFDSFDSFQRSLTDEIGGHDYIEHMHMKGSLSNVNLLSPCGKLLKVGNLYFDDAITARYLEQVDQFHLKFLQIGHFGFCVPEEIFDIPLVRNVNRLMVIESHIRDDQLIKMGNRVLNFLKCENLTMEGINKYIQKCVLDLDNKQVNFDIAFLEPTQNFDGLLKGLDISSSLWEDNVGEVIVNSESKQFQLEIRYSQGNIRGRTSISEHSEKRVDSRNHFTTAESVIIESFDTKRILAITKNGKTSSFLFDSSEELQVKLIEEFDRIDYIKELKIQSSSSNWIFCSRNEQITVGILEVDDERYIADYLQQIEPIHLKEISFSGPTDNQEIYDLQQIVEAKKLLISGCRMNYSQLLQLNATCLGLDSNGHKNTSHSGINAFLKKCILNLNKYDYNITLTGYFNENDTFDILEGLEVVKSKKTPPLEKVVLDSPYLEYQMKVSIHFNNITAKRITRYIDNKK